MEVVRRFFCPPGGSFFLFGPRGTGKSTWLRQHVSDAIVVDMLDPETFRTFAAKPERLREVIAGRPAVRDVVVDEVQRVPQLLDVVHQILEGKGSSPRFILTGSSARKLKRTGVDLLAGRALNKTLHPFMAAELGASFELPRALKLGMLPLVLASPAPEETLRSYVSLYLQQEVQAEGLVRNVGHFSRFLEAISLSHASQLNIAGVARECQVGRKTAEGYVEVLEDLLLGFRIGPFTKRAKRHLAVHPKFYYMDAGVFRSLRPKGPLDAPEEIGGACLEGLVAQHLRAWIAYRDGDCGLFYWRTKSGVEVDFVLYGEGTFRAFEVKAAGTVQRKDVRPLVAFREDYPEATTCLLYGGRERLRINGVPCVPCEEFLRKLAPNEPLGPVCGGNVMPTI